jgi:hypothetical protein
MNLRPNPIAIASAALALVCALPAHAAGPVDVTFLPDWRQYTDPGRDPTDAVRNEETLARHLQSLGTRWLADGQQLRIDVLDVDLSGSLRPARHAAIDEVRISRGGADVPRIKLRYTLSEGSRVIASGEETVSDLNYLRHGTDIGMGEPLRNEKRMLDSWFKARIVERKPAAG